jgi:two-component system cell cycle sensor histidine kinase/response regulator CckA
MISPNGVVFATNKKEWLFKTVLPMTQSQRQSLRKTKQFATEELLPLGYDFSQADLTLGKEKYHLTSTPIMDGKWRLIGLFKPPVLNAVVFGLCAFAICSFIVLISFGCRFYFGLILSEKQLKDIVQQLNSEITERKQMEEALKEAKAFIESTLNSIPEIFYSFDLNSKILIWNKPFSKISGYSDQELSSMKPMDFFLDEDVPRINESIERIYKEGTSKVTANFVLKDGRQIPCEFSGSLLKDGKGNVIGFSGTGRDITERKRAEKERVNLQEEILKARKLESIGTLAGGIAHDFNNLLYVVMGNISLAHDGLNLELETSESLKEAEQACIKAKELTARLITFAKGGDPVKKMMPINALLKDMVVLELSRFNIKPKIFIANDIRHVNIDEGQIKQIVRNIIVNAKEAMDDNGQLTVSCKNVDIAEEGYLILSQGEYIKISFEDQGCGISKENLEKIFDPYFSTKDMGVDKGQGLGLTISYSIIKKHGGLINVESKLETGSTFSVYLPAFSIKEPDLQKSEEKPAAQKPVKQPATGTGKILLMDDEEAIRTFLGRVINKLGYAVETCTEGKEAIEIYKKAMESKEPFDVVILDLTNKIGMGGQETMKRLLELDSDVKGIIITGYSDDPAVANFRAYGFSGFIIKPATKEELSKVIKEVLS